MDLETTGQAPSKGAKIIEIGIVVIENGEIVKEFATLINPKVIVPPFITQLTGINDQDLADAPFFEHVAEEIIELFKEGYIVAHNVPFDLGFLNQELKTFGFEPLHQPVVDTVELSRILIPQANGFKLGQLSDHLVLSHEDPHRALSDANVTAKLLLYLLEKLRSLPYETLYHLQQIEQRLKSDLYQLLDERIEALAFTDEERADLEIFRGLALKIDKEVAAPPEMFVPTLGDLLDDLYQENGKMESSMANYEDRPGQREMSEIIYDAFQSKRHALIEAETGTGKSLAYLIPALFEAVNSNQRIVISTHLTQLQGQLLEKEIPLLKQLLPFNFNTALLKGKQHYLSLKKFEHELMDLHNDNYDIALTKAILLVWLTETSTGDIDEVQLPSSGQILFRRISTDTEGSPDPRSPWFSRSFYQRARKRAQKADIIITNHSLLCTDMTSDYQLLPNYQKVIIDEAHHLEATAAKHFGLKLDYVTIQYLLNSIGTTKEGDWVQKLAKTSSKVHAFLTEIDWDELWQKVKTEADELFRFIFSYVVDQHKKDIAVNDIGRLQYRFDSKQETNRKWTGLVEMANRLSFFLRDMINSMSNIMELLNNQEFDSKDEAEELQTAIERTQEVIDGLEQLFLLDDQSQVKWIEIEAYGAKNAVYLYSEPVDVSTVLSDQLFHEKDSVVLTSATLTMKQSFRFIRERLGLEKKQLIEEKIKSPYLYENQVQLYVPNDFPNIKYGDQDEFIYAVCEAIYSLAGVSQGRMLVLFTSYDMLKKAHNILKEFTATGEFMLIAQGISSGSRSRLKKNFQAFDRAILLGTSSFWEGVDIPGNDLSCLVIVRLPFQPPHHPIYEAKAQHLQSEGKNAFMELALPNAVIRFKQGFGRLIRSSTDRGIVFVCDDRIINARYGKYFTESIPKVPISFTSTQKLITQAGEWL